MHTQAIQKYPDNIQNQCHCVKINPLCKNNSNFDHVHVYGWKTEQDKVHYSHKPSTWYSYNLSHVVISSRKNLSYIKCIFKPLDIDWREKCPIADEENLEVGWEIELSVTCQLFQIYELSNLRWYTADVSKGTKTHSCKMLSCLLSDGNHDVKESFWKIWSICRMVRCPISGGTLHRHTFVMNKWKRQWISLPFHIPISHHQRLLLQQGAERWDGDEFLECCCGPHRKWLIGVKVHCSSQGGDRTRNLLITSYWIDYGLLGQGIEVKRATIAPHGKVAKVLVKSKITTMTRFSCMHPTQTQTPNAKTKTKTKTHSDNKHFICSKIFKNLMPLFAQTPYSN